MRSVGELSRCGMLEVSVCRKMVRFVRDSVEVIDDFGGSGGLEPVGGKTHIVDASLGRLPVFFNNASKSVSFACVGTEGKWEEDVGLT